MPILYRYDCCSRKTIFTKDQGVGVYYSGFVPRGGVQLHQVDFTSEHDVCRKCKYRGTKNCVRTKLKAAKERRDRNISKPKEKDDGPVVIRFRRDRRG